MAVTLTTAARNAACDAIVDLIDGGTGAGKVELKTAASTVSGTNEAATLTFNDPAFGAAAVGVATMSTTPSAVEDTNATGGTATDATFFDSANTAVLQCSVGSGSGDIDLSSNVIGATDTVTITSMTITVPAS